MSRENVEVVQRTVEAFNRQDIKQLAVLCDAHVELVFGLFTGVDAGGAPYRGTEFLASYFARMNETWKEWTVEVEEVLDAGGDQVVALFRVVGKGKASGAPVEQAGGATFTLRDGKVWRARSYLDPGEALEAVGLRE